MREKIIEIRIGQLWLEEDNLLCLELKKGAKLTVDDIKEIERETERAFSFNENHVTCVDIRNIKSVTKEARELAASGGHHKLLLAVALIIGSSISRIIGNFYMRLNKPSYPLKLFTEKEKAFQWLKEFLD